MYKVIFTYITTYSSDIKLFVKYISLSFSQVIDTEHIYNINIPVTCKGSSPTPFIKTQSTVKRLTISCMRVYVRCLVCVGRVENRRQGAF